MPTNPTAATDLIAFTLDGQPVQAQPSETIWQAAQRHGVHIPHLCHHSSLQPDGNCRACVVEVQGERTLSPSCCRTPTPGMQVRAQSPRALKSQRMVVELLLSDMPPQGHRWVGNDATQPHGELSSCAATLGVAVRPALQALRRPAVAPDTSHPAIAVHLDACIQCNRCMRACRQEQANDVIGMALRGAHTQVVFDLNDPLAASTCVACGECVQACPTGALMPANHVGPQQVDRTVDSVCPYCGVGCQITYHVQDEKIVRVDGRNGPANAGRLCVKGRFGLDYAQHPDRLTQPLVRKVGVPKAVPDRNALPDWRDTFRPATWDEALALAADGLRQLRDQHGPKALAGFGSAKGSNEEAYLFQKLVRTGFGSNNVDHCTRLCHASSVAALLEGVGSGAVSNPVRDVEHADFILVIGANPSANHPVAATWIKNAARRGAKLVVADPRVTDLARHAWRVLPFKADTDVALLNALIHTIIEEGLVNQHFIDTRVSEYAALRDHIRPFSPEAMAPRCGIPAATLREVARAYATAPASMILWGMGISQHIHGTDNARCLIALASITGQIGRPGTGLHPLRGQNNVQGASDAGLIPMMFPNYQRVDNAQARQWFEAFWGLPLDAQPGYTVVEIMDKALAPNSDPHKVRGMYIMGENPAMSDPNLHHARHALASLQHLVVQDIFLTETAWLADVVLPATAWPEKTGTATNTDRTVQMGRPALSPPGAAQADLWIIQQIAQRVGPYQPVSPAAPAGQWHYPGPHAGVAAVYEEMRQAMHAAIGGIDWQTLQTQGSATYPCAEPGQPGQAVVFTQSFPTPSGRVRLVPAGIIPADESPDADYPYVLITGRQLEHWHTGSMTRRSNVLDALEPNPTATMHGDDIAAMGLEPGAWAQVRSRRGAVQLRLRRDDGTPRGAVFMPFAYAEAAANVLTNAALDPFGKIPEFKYCAVAIGPVEPAVL